MKKWTITLVVALLASTVSRGASEVAVGMPLDLVVKDKVQKELELSETQIEKVKSLYADARKDGKALSKSLAALVQELKPQQWSRLREISLQVRGGLALLDDEVSKTLGLTDKQKETCRQIWQEQETRLQNFLAVSRFSSKEARDTFIADKRKETGQKLLTTLSEAQKKQFAAMQGKPFDTTGLDRE